MLDVKDEPETLSKVADAERSFPVLVLGRLVPSMQSSLNTFHEIPALFAHCTGVRH
ncbi:MAG TPA: hypothetical protein VLA19_06760 [Herpetosiphonaceae bacterium]|nr:hypothetical protein [Herpetosiphonaceae bacterium]